MLVLESGDRATMLASPQNSRGTWISHGASWSQSGAPGSYRGCMVNRGAGGCSGSCGNARGKAARGGSG